MPDLRVCESAAPYAEILDLDGAAQYLGCSSWLARKLLAAGDLPGFKLGREWRVRLSSLRAYAASLERRPVRNARLPERAERGRFRAGQPTPLLEATANG
jgi:excisionase family DNA binding protein